jgi:hypothetical protein
VRPVAFVFAALVVFAASAGIGGSSAAVGGVAVAPRVALVATYPVSIRGTGFRAAERVRVEVVAGSETMTRAATGSAAGTFAMRMPRLSASNCQGFSMTATGNKGSRASFKRAPGQCPILGGSG